MHFFHLKNNMANSYSSTTDHRRVGNSDITIIKLKEA